MTAKVCFVYVRSSDTAYVVERYETALSRTMLCQMRIENTRTTSGSWPRCLSETCTKLEKFEILFDDMIIFLKIH